MSTSIQSNTTQSNSIPQQIAASLQKSFETLCKTFALLQPEEIDNGRITSGWSPKALMEHVGFWDDAQTCRIQALLADNPLAQNWRAVMLENDERAALDDSRSWDEVVSSAESARQRMVEFVSNLTPVQCETEHPEGERKLSASKLFQHMLRHTTDHSHEIQVYSGSMQRWTRPGLRRFVLQQYTSLMDSVGGLDETTILRTIVCGKWSMRDVLAHVLSWNEFEQKALRSWPSASQEKLAQWLNQPDETDEAINDRLMETQHDFDMIAIVDGLATYHRKVLTSFDKASDELLSTPAEVGWSYQPTMSGFIYEMSLHDLEHAEDIWRWRAENMIRDV